MKMLIMKNALLFTRSRFCNVSNRFRDLGILALLVFLFLPRLSFSQFRVLETRDLRLIYFDDYSYVVPHLARSFENALKFHKSLFQYNTGEKVTVILHDFSDYGFGGTTSIPRNLILVGLEPFDYVYETQPANERMNWLMNHELAHVVAFDNAAGSDRFFRALFMGKVEPIAENPLSMIYSYLSIPRRYAPRWYHEGFAVFMETWMAGGMGRVLGGYDEMVFRTMVNDHAYIYDVVGLESEGTAIDFQIGQNSYLYGTRFLTYLANSYGTAKLLQWVNRTPGSKAYFASQFKRVYGVSLDEEWQKWIAWERRWQEENLRLIREYPVTPYRPILSDTLGSISRTYFQPTNRKLYTAINFPGQLAQIVEIDLITGQIRKLCDVPTPALYYVTFLAYNPYKQEIYYTTDNSRYWRDLNVVDIKTGKHRVLIKDFRAGDLVFNLADSSIWGVQHHNGISTLIRIPSPYKVWYDIFPLSYGRDLFDLDISPSGKFLTAGLIEISGRQRLIRMNIDSLLAGSSSFEVLYEFANNAPQNFVFSPDGKYLYGTSYYTGASNVFRYDFANKKMDAVTNCETGFFRPVPVWEDSLIVFRYTGKGFIPVVIPNRVIEDVNAIRYLGQQVVKNHSEVKSWSLPSPRKINIDSLTTFKGFYKPFKEIRIASAYPVVEGYKDFAVFGWRFNLSDPVGFHSIDLTASYSPNRNLAEKERIHFGLNYHFWNWELGIHHNNSDFYDLFGPTKTSRKGTAFYAKYGSFLLSQKPKTLQYSFRFSGFRGLERLPDFQNIAASFDRFYTLSGKLEYKYLLRSLGAVEYEEGVEWQLQSFTYYVRSQLFPHFFSNLSYGFLLPLNHSSIWIRTSAGQAFGERSDPFANFFFGGFGNNWVDHLSEKRFREYYSFPGVELNEVGGRNYVKGMIEWDLPPVRFRRLGVTSFYVTWSRFSLFSSAIMTNLDKSSPQRKLVNLGGQVDFKLVMFSALQSTFSLGYAVAFEKRNMYSNEFMISLKIL